MNDEQRIKDRIACNCCGPHHDISPSNQPRRRFLTQISGLSLAAALSSPTWNGLADAQELKGAKPWIIDVHHHFIPKFYVEEFEDRIVAAGARRPLVAVWTSWSPEKTIEVMDLNGVATSILSLTFPGIWFGDALESRKLARRVNDYGAEISRRYPSRFGLFACIPLPDQEGSLREIEYSLDTLKADGIGLLTSYGDKWLGDASFDPVFAELDRRQAVVFVHPTAPNCCKGLIPNIPSALAEVPQDTARAITNLLFTGTFTRFKNIRFVFSHAGGTMPMLYGRMHQYGPKDLKDKVPLGIEYEIKRQFYDIAGTAFRPAIAALRSIVPTSQILFGSDNPFIPLSETVLGLPDLNFKPEELKAIQRGNALNLLARTISS
jgi:predicted TIM-barrel fold metal-dependent hydrolase